MSTRKLIALPMVALFSAGCATAGMNMGEEVIVPEGTEIMAEFDRDLSPRADVGEEITATVTRPVTDGEAIAIPAGSRIRGQVTAVQRVELQGEPREVDVVKVDFNEIEANGRTYPLEARITEVQPDMQARGDLAEDAAKVGGGALAGAILGRIIGGDDESAVIGAAVGAVAGTAIVLGTRDEQLVLPEGSLVRLSTERPLRVRV